MGVIYFIQPVADLYHAGLAKQDYLFYLH